MQFFLDDTDATPIRLFSANNAPHPRASRSFVARPPLARGNRSVPGYPYIRFVNDDDYDGSYPFDAFQDLRSAYSTSSLSDIQAQLRVLQQQRAQAQLRRALLEQQQQTIAQREHELLAYQRQLEKQRQEQARAASERARLAYLSRLREDEQQKQLENQRQAQKASRENEAATSGKDNVVFFPPFHFFDHILDSQFRSQDEVERRRAHKSALSDLLDLYFSDAASKPTSDSQSLQSVERESGPKAPVPTPATSRKISVVGPPSDEQRSLPYGARAQEPDPALLDNVLRVVHDRLAEIGAEEDAEKAREATREASRSPPTLSTDARTKTKATPQKADVDIVEEPASSPPPTPSAKIPRNSPPIGSDVEVEEPTDYNRLARLLRNRVHGLGDEDVFVPLSPLGDNEHSPEPDELPKVTSQEEKDTQQEEKPAEDEANEHTDSEFADMLDDCKCQLREMKEADGKQDHQRATRRRHRRHNRKHKQSKRAKKAAEKQQQQQQQLAAEGPEEQRQRQAVKTIEDYVLGAKSKRVAKQVRESLSSLHHLELELDQIRKDYSRRVNDTQLSFVADKNGDLRLAYNRDNSAFHAYKDTLQRLLLKLDTIPSYGDEVIRAKRRSIVIKIQDTLDALDRLASEQESEHSASSPSEGAMADVSSNNEY